MVCLGHGWSLEACVLFSEAGLGCVLKLLQWNHLLMLMRLGLSFSSLVIVLFSDKVILVSRGDVSLFPVPLSLYVHWCKAEMQHFIYHNYVYCEM